MFNNGDKKTLIVDDEDYIITLLEKMLNQIDIKTLSASEAETGLLLFLEESPDIVFCDYVMPGMEVTTFYRAIKAINKSIPIVMITGYIELMTNKMENLDIKLDYVLEKPFTRESMMEILKECFPDYIDKK